MCSISRRRLIVKADFLRGCRYKILVFTKVNTRCILVQNSKEHLYMDETEQSHTELEIGEIERLIREFKEKFKTGTSNANNFLSITELELLWGELQNRTNNIYSDMIRKLMSEVDEHDLIRKKKQTIDSKG